MFHGVRVGSGLQTDITFVATLYASTPCRSAGTVIYSITARHGIRVVPEVCIKVTSQHLVKPNGKLLFNITAQSDIKAIIFLAGKKWQMLIVRASLCLSI